MLNKDEIEKLYEEAYIFLESNDLEEVWRIISKLEKSKSKYACSLLSNLYIDLGLETNDSSLINKSIIYIEEHLDYISKIFTPASIYYNLANGYLNYYSITSEKFVNGENIIIKIKDLYKRSLTYYNGAELNIKVQSLVNLGNLHMGLGRYIDALEYYENALKLNPTHGMALVNKGICLLKLRFLVNHDGLLLKEAYISFKESLKSNNLTFSAKNIAQEQIKIFEENNSKEFLNNIKISRIKINDNYTNLEEFSNLFCLKNKLYLNLCNFCQQCVNCIGDSICIKQMTLPIKENEKLEDDKFLILSSYLNQIKMDFISSRFNLILSQYNELDLNFINNNVIIIDSYDYELHNIRIQLLKDSFKNFYNILDKISFFINFYLDLNIDKNQVNFKNVWYKNFKKKKIRDDLDFDNNGLKALFNIHEDILYGEEKKLYDIRNALTHRSLKIKFYPKEDENDAMTEKELFEAVIKISKLVRNAIIYLLYFVDYIESKKQTDNSIKLFVTEVPDDLK